MLDSTNCYILAIVTAHESGQVKVLHMSVCLSICLCFQVITFEQIVLLTSYLVC